MYVDEFTTAAGQSTPVPSITVTGPVSPLGSKACFLSAKSSSTWLYDQEGIPSLATTKAFLTFPCYAGTAGVALATNVLKVAAVVSFSGNVNTSTTLATTLGSTAGTANFPTALRHTVSTGDAIWFAYSAGFAAGTGTAFMYTPRLGLYN